MHVIGLCQRGVTYIYIQQIMHTYFLSHRMYLPLSFLFIWHACLPYIVNIGLFKHIFNYCQFKIQFTAYPVLIWTAVPIKGFIVGMQIQYLQRSECVWMPVLSQMLCKCEWSMVKVCIVFPVWIMQVLWVFSLKCLPVHERIFVGNTFKG
jgi:hypothetical protein